MAARRFPTVRKRSKAVRPRRTCTNMRGRGSEHQEQALFVARFRVMFPKFERLLFSVPNGGKRTKIEAAAMKAEGTQPGVPDLILAVARGIYHGLYVEMKRASGGVLSPDQVVMIALLREQGYAVEVCSGAADAWSTTMRYLKLCGGEQLAPEE